MLQIITHSLKNVIERHCSVDYEFDSQSKHRSIRKINDTLRVAVAESNNQSSLSCFSAKSNTSILIRIWSITTPLFLPNSFSVPLQFITKVCNNFVIFVLSKGKLFTHSNFANIFLFLTCKALPTFPSTSRASSFLLS